MTTKETMGGVDPKKRAAQSIVCGMVIGFICGEADASLNVPRHPAVVPPDGVKAFFEGPG